MVEPPMCGVRIVVHATQRRLELVLVALGLDREHVNRRTQQLAGLQRRCQRIDVHHRPARGIDQDAARLHGGDLLGAEHAVGGGQLGHMQGHDIGLAQQLLQIGGLARIAQRQLGDHVVEDDLHAQAFGQHRQLGADGAIAHNAQGLAADLVGVVSTLLPAAAVGHGVLFGDAAQQQNRLGQHQLGHRTGVGERRVEHGNAALARASD
jgi:hypothetical protein